MQKRSNRTFRVVALLLSCASFLAFGQTTGSGPAPPPGSAVQTFRHYYYALGLHWFAARFAKALPGEFDQPGHERRSLSGTITTVKGTTSFSFTRQLDEDVRLDLTGTTSTTLIASGLLGQPTLQTNSPAASASANYDLLETLAEDSPEGLLFSFGSGAALLWLGENFRIDDGTNPDYTGPYYDIYRQNTTLKTVPNSPERNKLFYFDSATKLLAFTRYQIQRNATTVDVEVSYSGWATVAGQLVPAQIVRKENGLQVFSVSTQSAASVPSQTDTLFTLGG